MDLSSRLRQLRLPCQPNFSVDKIGLLEMKLHKLNDTQRSQGKLNPDKRRIEGLLWFFSKRFYSLGFLRFLFPGRKEQRGTKENEYAFYFLRM